MTFSSSVTGPLGQNVCPASDTRNNLRTMPNLEASEGTQSSIPLSDVGKSIVAKAEKLDCVRITLEEEEEQTEGERGRVERRERR